MAYVSLFLIDNDILTVASGVTLLYCSDVQSPRAQVIMLIVFLFYSEFPEIFLHYAPNPMHYSQHFSQDCSQNNSLTLEIMLNCNALTFSIRVLQYNPVV